MLWSSIVISKSYSGLIPGNFHRRALLCWLRQAIPDPYAPPIMHDYEGPPSTPRRDAASEVDGLLRSCGRG
jgi:hypothetical protein